MTTNGILQLVIFFVLLMLITKPLGSFMAKVFDGERTFMSPIVGWLERLIYRVCGIDPNEDMKWTKYAGAMLMFSIVGLVLTYGLLRLQGVLPLNPQNYGVKQMTPDLAFNTASSFTTNTNWQNYSPELALSYFSNMVSLAIHNWMSAACGIAIAIALIRGFARRSANGIGNFWADTVRATLYVLLPICFITAIVFLFQGMPQTFQGPTQYSTLEGGKQIIGFGPVASQEAIKQLGTNGGGFFNANSAHPFENPTPFTDFLTKLMIFSIGAGLTYTLGKMVGNVRQGWAVFAAMSVLFIGGAVTANYYEQAGNPQVAKMGVLTEATSTQPGGNMEGKEVRFGIPGSTMFATITTDASCGAVNSMHDSFTPIGGLVPLFNILTGEVIFGGVGAGLYGMLMYAVIAVFIAGLMVGRTPEYLGKKIQKFEVQMAMLAVLVLAADVLFFTAFGSTVKLPKEPEASFAAQLNKWPGSAYGGSDTFYGPGTGNMNNGGPHGFSEMLYQFASQTGNNGSAFAGLTGNTPIFNTAGGFAMLIGRFLMIIPLLAIAGSLARKKHVPESAGTFPTDKPTFSWLLVGVIIIVSALTYFPAMALGPIVEQFLMNGGKTF